MDPTKNPGVHPGALEGSVVSFSSKTLAVLFIKLRLVKINLRKGKQICGTGHSVRDDDRRMFVDI